MSNEEKEEEKKKEIEEKEIKILNRFFGIIIFLSSILIVISFFIVKLDTQIIIFSFNLFIIGVAFTCIGIPDKEQGVKAANTEIWGGGIITIAGLICFFISLISSNLIDQILFMINCILLFAGIVAFAAGLSERKTKTKSKWIMGGSGFVMALFPAIYIVSRIFELFGIISIDNIEAFVNIMNILLFISICGHGFARFIIYYTGIYIKD